MATIYERFQKLGLETNQSILSATGAWVSQAYKIQHLPFDQRQTITQKEGDNEYPVYLYPDHWTEEMDKIILKYVSNPTERPIPKEETKLPAGFDKPKRKRIQRIPSKPIPPLDSKLSEELDNCI